MDGIQCITEGVHVRLGPYSYDGNETDFSEMRPGRVVDLGVVRERISLMIVSIISLK